MQKINPSILYPMRSRWFCHRTRNRDLFRVQPARRMRQTFPFASRGAYFARPCFVYSYFSLPSDTLSIINFCVSCRRETNRSTHHARHVKARFLRLEHAMLDIQKLVPAPLNPKSDREIDDSSTLSLVLGYLVQPRLICGYLLQPRNRCLASFSTAIRIPEATPLKSMGKKIYKSGLPWTSPGNNRPYASLLTCRSGNVGIAGTKGFTNPAKHEGTRPPR
jgi:hypothetical protein